MNEVIVSDDELADVFASAYWRSVPVLFDGGPSLPLIGLVDASRNAWFVEPALVDAYVALCGSGSIPVPVSVEDARRVSWSFVNGSSDEWGPLVVVGEGAVALCPADYCTHVALLLEVHGLSVDGLIELRSRPCRSDWSFAADPEYQQLFSISNDGRK